ncbi:LLM class F420-dependent oxidoreductase [Microbispora sp. ATCC PTA-5024]|uniref:LLM class F420-dependent oxidoreductase n=1 Tax=Microbispora sp. ATCC PTA-5024 TaxID=316330 RepID=UPI0003DD8AAF|nr:LLM class F420-dependent oxidoreductase [Microbispora sp. ATCC PTA-5024]ETK34005.1 N5,N10-methylenetetrahydromethanopterin reductase [Microbispora sp. ATCC PTA-5024]
MDSGFGYFATHDSVRPDALARLVEQRGHQALLFTEHTHIPVPVGRGVPADERGGDLPRRYWHTYDPFVASMAAGLATTRLRVGTGICLVPQHEPIGLAKTVASVDDLTGGRFEFGVGAGWNAPETANHGVDFRRRFGVMREHIEAMRTIWTRPEASYHGEHVSFDPIWSWPKPAQRPHPPILVGGTGRRVFERVLAYGDAWLPNYGPGVLDRTAELFRLAEEEGRPVEVMLLSVPSDPRVLEECEKAGVSRVMAWLPSAGLGRIERAMDAFEEALADYRGE